MKRRNFIQTLGVAGALSSFSFQNKKHALRFGICTDVHKDIMHDADSRLEKFISSATNQNLDFIIQLGDFCRPYDHNLEFMRIWNAFPGKKYHVIGNHDMDGGFSREQVVEYWKSEGKYYSFDCKGFHFVVLDGNDHDNSPDRPSGYARFIGDEQLDWLKSDLESAKLPVVVFCHQGLDNDMGGISNATKTRLVFENANGKVKLVFSGHHHQDYYNVINGIQYVQVNSMSYHWLGENYKTVRYNEEVDQKYPWIKYTAPYKEPLWATIELSEKGVKIEGSNSEFVGVSPESLGLTNNESGYPVVAKVSYRKLKF